MQKVKLEKERLKARRACLEADLLELEIERRKALLGSDREESLGLAEWAFAGQPPGTVIEHEPGDG
jgi:hypothetical protein